MANRPIILVGRTVILLFVIVLTTSVLAFGGVSVPNTFTSGTPAKASEVNANFQALANTMPAIKSAFTHTAITYITALNTGTTGDELQSLQVTLPAAGKVMVSVSGTVCVASHTSGISDGATLFISKTSGDINYNNSNFYIIDTVVEKDIPAFTNNNVCVPFSITGVFDETSAGLTTYYLNGIKRTSFDTFVTSVSMNALYVPATL